MNGLKVENEKLRGLLRAVIKTGELTRQQHEELEADICAALSQQADPECRCTMRQRLVGDGCFVCNPEYAADHDPVEPAGAQDERDSFERYRLAGEFCVSRGIDDDSEIRPKILDAFCSGYACAGRPALTEQQTWTDSMVRDFLSVALRHVEVKGALHAQDIRDALRYMAERYAAPIAQTALTPWQEATGRAAFKNFHRSLCERFSYTHDEEFWWRDLISLEEHVAKLTAPQPEQSGLTDDSKEAAMQKAFELGGLEDGSYHLESDELELVIRSALSTQGDKP